MYKIVCDSAANMQEFVGEVEVASVPLKIITDEREFVDEKGMNVSEMAGFLSTYKGKSSTACPSVADWLDAFGDAEYVFCFTITSTLSGSCNAARLAKEDYEAEHPERHVCIVDSLSAGPEMKILVEKTIELLKSGMPCAEVCEQVHKYMNHTRLLFCLESMRNLANNGRVSPAVAKLAGLLGIRVVGQASTRGDLEQLDKCRGEKSALSGILKNMKKMGFNGGKVRIDHCENPEASQQLKNLILKDYPQTDVIIDKTFGLCSFYAEKGGLMIGFEVE